MTLVYENALAEVDSILKLMPEDLLNKIPNSFLNFIEQKKSKSYTTNFNFDRSLNEQNLLKETRTILSLIYRSYLCSSKQRRKLKIDDIIELKKNQIERNKKYSYENLFHKKNYSIYKK